MEETRAPSASTDAPPPHPMEGSYLGQWGGGGLPEIPTVMKTPAEKLSVSNTNSYDQATPWIIWRNNLKPDTLEEELIIFDSL